MANTHSPSMRCSPNSHTSDHKSTLGRWAVRRSLVRYARNGPTRYTCATFQLRRSVRPVGGRCHNRCNGLRRSRSATKEPRSAFSRTPKTSGGTSPISISLQLGGAHPQVRVSSRISSRSQSTITEREPFSRGKLQGSRAQRLSGRS